MMNKHENKTSRYLFIITSSLEKRIGQKNNWNCLRLLEHDVVRFNIDGLQLKYSNKRFKVDRHIGNKFNHAYLNLLVVKCFYVYDIKNGKKI